MMMLHRVLSVFLVALALAVWASAPAGAADMHQGKVVEVGVGKLTMTDMAGKNQHSQEVATDAGLNCEGKECGLKVGAVGEIGADNTDMEGCKNLGTKGRANREGR